MKILPIMGWLLVCIATIVDSRPPKEITAEDCSYEAVLKAINMVEYGGMVNIPKGTSIWTKMLYISKSVRVKGAGIDSTTLINGIENNGAEDFLFSLQPKDNCENPFIEIANMTLDANTEGGCIRIISQNKQYAYNNFRIHNNKLMNTKDDDGDSYMCIRTKGDCFGLIDSNLFVNNHYDFKIYGNDRNSWDSFPGVSNIGGPNYLYIENNVSTSNNYFVLTSGEGARWVYRYNETEVSRSQSVLDAHGNTNNDGVVAFEVYNNIIIDSNKNTGDYSAVDYRGGTGLIYDNQFWGGISGTRIIIKVREEYEGCEDSVNNGYIWNNINPNDNKIIAVWVSNPYECIKKNVNWWDDAAHVPGGEDSSDFTYGLLSERHESPTNNQCFWATDVKKLYRSIGGDNWTFIYTPYEFPHPLSNGPPISINKSRVH